MTERKEYVTRLQSNTVLSRDVISSSGYLVIASGTDLTSSQIVRLKQMGVLEVWVRDKVVNQTDSVLDPKITHNYQETIICMQELFEAARINQNLDLAPTRKKLEQFAETCGKESNFLKLVFNLRTLDEYTFQHSIGVGLLARQIAEWMGLTHAECNDLYIAASLHDIGKCMIDEAIIMKPGRLTDEEYQTVKQHTTLGYMILRNSSVPEHLACPALNHHERMDGRGYPNGLQGHEIDLFSRITAVADVFNAMTSRRVYKNAISIYKVLDELQNNAFGELDFQIVSLFVQKMTTYFTGNVVELNDGTLGTVVMIPAGRPTRPLLRTETGFIDLQSRPDLYVESVRSI